MDGDEAVKETIGEGEGFLAIADYGLHTREHTPDIGSHVFPKFVSVVMGFLFGRELFVVDVLAQAGAYFKGSLKIGAGVFDRKRVVKVFDHSVARTAGELNVPQFHELVAA